MKGKTMFKNAAQKIAETAILKTANAVGSYLAHTDAKAEKKNLDKPSNVVWGQGNYQEVKDAVYGKLSIDTLYPEKPNTLFAI